MKLLFTFICFFTFQVFCNGQIVTIVDEKSGDPLEMVTISSESPRAFTITNTKGQADIHLFKGALKIEIRILGYQTIYLTYDEIEVLSGKIKLNEAGVKLDELIISGTRWNQNTKEIPMKVTSINSKSATLQNPQTSADVLASSGEVFIQKSQQGGGSPMIRGFSTNRLLYVVDGVRMNNAIFRSGNIQNVISIDPFTNDKIEVLFGPGSVLYGSDAIGGVMNFTTHAPQFSYNNKTDISGKSTLRFSTVNNERTGHLHLNVGWKKWALVSSYSNFNFNDLKMGNNGPDDYLSTFYVKNQGGVDVVLNNSDPLIQIPTGYSQTNLMQKVGFKPNDLWKFDYIFHFSTTSDFDRYDRLIRTKDGLPRSAEWYYGPQKWMMNQLAITHTHTVSIYDEFTIRVAHQFFEESRHDRDFQDTEKRNRKEKVNAYSLNFDLVKFINSNHKLAYGAEAVINDVNSQGNNLNIATGITSPASSRYPQSTWQSYAVYFNLLHKLSDKIDFIWGGRYNYCYLDATFDTTFFPFPFTETTINNGSLSGSIGVVARPTEKWVLSINAATGFRSPNVDDVGKVFDSEPGSVVVPNPNLKAENVYNFEFGIAKIFGDFLKVDFTSYYTLLLDAMVRRNYNLGGMDSIIYDGELSNVQAIQNASKAIVYGVQAGFELKIWKGIGLSSRVNYQKGEEELDDGSLSPLRHAAPMFGITQLTYTFKNLTLDLYHVFNGEISNANLPEEFKSSGYLFAKDANGNPYSPSWHTINFKLIYKISDLFTISSGIENIMDERYRPYSSGIAAAGRNFIFALNIKF